VLEATNSEDSQRATKEHRRGRVESVWLLVPEYRAVRIRYDLGVI
jgi:hypothetical protein